MSFLELKEVVKGYGTGDSRTEVLSDINLSVEENEFVAIIGFSGTGKTTLISLLAGLLKPDQGTYTTNGETVKGPGPELGIIFQNYSLLPWLTVLDNVALAVNQVFPKWSKEKRDAHTRKFIEMVNLTPAIEKRPHELSGGMRQRVSVARALAMNPKVLLMDEPFGALDALTRGTLQNEVAKIWEQEKKTVVLITNDVDEAMLLADRIIPLKPGKTATLGPSFAVNLERPRNRTELNKNPEFRRIRNEVTNYLIRVRKEEAEAADVQKQLPLPDLKPVDLSTIRRPLATA